MSDISSGFDAVTMLLVVLYVTWPTTLVGIILGAVLWKRHRIWGALLGAVLGVAIGWTWWIVKWWGLRP